MIQVHVDRHDASRLIDALRIASGEEAIDPATLRRHYPTTAARYTQLANTLGDALDGLPARQEPSNGPDLQLSECQIAARLDAHPATDGGASCGACGPLDEPWSRHAGRVLLAP